MAAGSDEIEIVAEQVSDLGHRLNSVESRLAEIEKVIDELPPKELTKLAAYVIHRDKVAWDQEIEEDFSPGGKHEKALAKIACVSVRTLDAGGRA